ncbi:MAG TPA: hypothetical protein VL495_06495 [Edaphobacter sp.]|nr:hypothetical protein [Edaphobacter sp.]
MFLQRVGFAFCLVLFGMVAVGTAGAQGRVGSLAGGTSPTSGGEVTVTGVVAKKAADASGGTNFSMSGSQHALMVNPGPGLSKQMRSRIQAGESVQVTGVMRTIHGQDYLLAREMVIGGTKVQVRNAKGMPVQDMGTGRPQPRRVTSDLKGGAR